MKNIFCGFSLVCVIILFMGGCIPQSNNPVVSQTTNSTSTQTSEETSTTTIGTDATKSSNSSSSSTTTFYEQSLVMISGLEYGTYTKPHALGESVHVGFRDFWGKNIRYDVVFKQVLSGNEAKQKAIAWGATDEEDQEILDEHDIYMVEYQITYDQAGVVDPISNIGAVNAQGENVSLDLMLSYFYTTPNFTTTEKGEEGWATVIVEKGIQCIPALFIGSEMEAPGIVVTFYFAKE